MKLLLVVAWIAVDLALMDWMGEQGIVWPDAVAACVLGVALGQCSLVAMWCAWSPANTALRVALAGLSLYALAWLASSVVAEPAARDKWFTLLLIQAMLLAAVCLADALLNPESLQHVFQSRGPARQQHIGARSYQFSLAGLMTLTTASAMVLGTVQWTALPARPLPLVLSFCLLATANCFPALCLLPQRRWFGPLAGTLLIGVLLGWLMGRTGLPPCDSEKLILTGCAQAATVTASLAVCRLGAA